MKPDMVQIELESTESGSHSTYNVSTRITAYLTDGEHINKNTLVFDCDPIGNNYRRTYLEVKFGDWSKVARIRDFLAHHFSVNKDVTRTLSVPIEEGHYSTQPLGDKGHESDNFDKITVRASGHRIEFGGMSNMTPNIRTYERLEDGEPTDNNNVTKLLDFFKEITSHHPITQTALHSDDEDQGMNRQVHRLFNQYTTTAQLNAIAESGDQLYQDYQKAVNEFKNQEYSDAVRDIGRAGEALIELLCNDIYEEAEIPQDMNGRLNKLDKTEEGLPSYVGKTFSTVWWLRNKANHPADYEIAKADAHFALLCFQTAVEKYVEEFRDVNVVY